jgi:hypothetical protein
MVMNGFKHKQEWFKCGHTFNEDGNFITVNGALCFNYKLEGDTPL